MQSFDHFSVNGTRGDTELFPEFLSRLRCPTSHQLSTITFTEFIKSDLTNLSGDFVIRSLLGFNTKLLSKFVKLYNVFDFVVRGFTFSCGYEYTCHTSAVVTVGACPRRYRPEKIAGDNSISVRATDANLRPVSKRVNSARPHRAYSAADTKLAEAALWLLLIQPVPGIFYARVSHMVYHFLGCFITATFFRLHKQLLANQLTPKTEN
jgi:hypothetical protein